MALKTFLIDLSHLRFGRLIKIEDMPNVAGMKKIVYQPPGKFFDSTIINIPEGAIDSLTKEEVGGIADAEKIVIVWYGEGGISPFLNRVQEKIATLSQELESLKRKRAIELGVAKAKEVKLSQDLLEEVKKLERIRKLMEKKKPTPFRIGVGGEE